MSQKDEAIAHFARSQLASFTIATHDNYEINWHHKDIFQALEEAERGLWDFVFIFMPPRHGKTEIASIKFPAWYLGRNPTKSIICSSYSGELASDFGEKTRNLMTSDRFKTIFPNVRLSESSYAKDKFMTINDGTYFAVGIGGSTTGRGANIFLIDDPVKDREEADSSTIQKRNINWYSSVAETRLEPNACVVLICTRWHENDLAGWLLKQIKNLGRVKILNIPALAIKNEIHRKEGEALWPGRFSLETLLKKKSRMRPRDWNALYQQTPISEETKEFYPEWFKYYDEPPPGLLILTIVDPAFSKNENSDFCAILTVGLLNHDVYVLDYVNERFGPDPAIINKNIIIQAKKWNPYKIGVEAFASQVMLGYTLREALKAEKLNIEVLDLRVPNYKNSNVQKSRIRSLIPKLREGKIYFKRWMTDLEQQLLKFPAGENDDLADGLSMYQHFKIDMGAGFKEEDENENILNLGNGSIERYNDFGEPIL